MNVSRKWAAAAAGSGVLAAAALGGGVALAQDAPEDQEFSVTRAADVDADELRNDEAQPGPADLPESASFGQSVSTFAQDDLPGNPAQQARGEASDTTSADTQASQATTASQSAASPATVDSPATPPSAQSPATPPTADSPATPPSAQSPATPASAPSAATPSTPEDTDDDVSDDA